MSMPAKNIVAAIVLILFGIAYAYLTLGLPERSLPNTPGPAFFPWLILTIMMVLAVALLGQAVRRLKSANFLETGIAFPRKAAALLLWMTAFAASLPFAGFLIGGIIFFAGLMVIFGARNPLVIVFWSVALPSAVFFLFRDVFQVLLPSGKWLVI